MSHAGSPRAGTACRGTLAAGGMAVDVGSLLSAAALGLCSASHAGRGPGRAERALPWGASPGTPCHRPRSGRAPGMPRSPGCAHGGRVLGRALAARCLLPAGGEGSAVRQRMRELGPGRRERGLLTE